MFPLRLLSSFALNFGLKASPARSVNRCEQLPELRVVMIKQPIDIGQIAFSFGHCMHPQCIAPDESPVKAECCHDRSRYRKPTSVISIRYLERRAVLRSRAAVIVDPRGADVGVAQP